MYLAGNKNSADTTSWADSLSWTKTVVETVAVDTGKALPSITKQEAQKQLQELLSGVKK